MTNTSPQPTKIEMSGLPGYQECDECGAYHDGDADNTAWVCHEYLEDGDKVLCAECDGKLTDAQRVQCASDGCECCGEVVCEGCDKVFHADNLYTHSWGCVRLCEACAMEGGEPQCPREHREGDCDWCIAKWAEIDGEACNVCKKREPENDLVDVITATGCERWCEECAADKCVECGAKDAKHHPDDDGRGEPYCERCMAKFE